jgi:hypothetical protein
MTASTFIYWQASGNRLASLNFIEPTGFCAYENDQLLRSDIVIFVREILSAQQASALAICRELKIPHFYFIDDNFILLADERKEFRDYTEERLKKELKSFSGVITSSEELARFFSSLALHHEVNVIRPVINQELLAKTRNNRLRAPSPQNTLRVAFFGGPFRQRSLLEDVFPALNELDQKTELLMRCSSHSGPIIRQAKFEIVPIVETASFSAFLERWSQYEPQIAVHPAGRTQNIDYKSANALLVALYLGTVPIVTHERAYSSFGKSEGVMKVDGSSRSWANAIEQLSNEAFRQEMLGRLDIFCGTYFDAERTIRVLARLTQDTSPLDDRRSVERLRRAFTMAQNKYIELVKTNK